jgi:hypothetical protein
MKIKLTALAISSAILLSACGNDAEEPVKVIAPEVEVVKEPLPEPEPPKKPEFSWDWEEPTTPYYTLGTSPLDPVGLVSRYELDKESVANTHWFVTGDTVGGFYKGKEAITLYTHTNLYDEPEKATDKQSAAINDLLKAKSQLQKNCKKLTEKMSSELVSEEFTSPLTILKDNKGKKEQTWFFENKDEGYILVSTRDIEKPKGYIVRCKDEFSDKILKPALSGITLSF